MKNGHYVIFFTILNTPPRRRRQAWVYFTIENPAAAAAAAGLESGWQAAQPAEAAARAVLAENGSDAGQIGV